MTDLKLGEVRREQLDCAAPGANAMNLFDALRKRIGAGTASSAGRMASTAAKDQLLLSSQKNLAKNP